MERHAIKGLISEEVLCWIIQSEQTGFGCKQKTTLVLLDEADKYKAEGSFLGGAMSAIFHLNVN